jgi:digeranylgeranylglycerophospholipid reductase
MKKTAYDAVVVGAGPGGSMAAFEIASAGFSVLLLEKDERPGTPLCCAEGVFGPTFANIVDIDDRWISTKIEQAEIIAPGGERVSVHYRNAGYVLDRAVFDYDLARKASVAGAELECGAIGRNPRGENRLFDSLEVVYPDGDTVEVKTRIIIAADGVESRIARQAGLDNRLDTDKVATALEYRVDNIEIERDKISFHVGRDVAPGGYLWVFPKSEKSVNIGLAVAVDEHEGRDPAGYLDRFMKREFPEGEIVSRHCGLLPSYMGRGMFRIGSILTVGDAARSIDSLSGAGIINALLSGKYAGEAAAEYLSGRIDDIEKIDSIYPDKFLEIRGGDLNGYLRLRKAYVHFDDNDFKSVIKVLRKYLETHSAYDIHAAGLLMKIIKTTPRLLRLVRYLI